VQNADRIFAHAQSLRPDSIEALVGRALVRIDDHHEEEAIELLRRAPDSPAMESLRSVARGENPKLDLGTDWLASASSTELFVDGLRLQKQAERAPRAERKAIFQVSAARFTEAVNRSPGARAFFHVKRAFATRDAGDEAGVRSASAALSALWPDSSRAVFTAGNALSRYDRKESIRLLRRAIALDPQWGPPYQILGNVHVFASEWADAIAVLNEALRRDPRDADAFNTIGLAYDRLGCREDSGEAYARAIALRPGMFEAWINLAQLRYFQRDYAGAEAPLRKAIELAPYEPFPHSLLAMVLHRGERHEEALHEFEIALGFGKAESSTWGAYSATLTSLGDPHLGLTAADIAVEMNPKEPDHVRVRDAARERIAKAAAER
jgi:tetratricopeptide (TPR) repeat protein